MPSIINSDDGVVSGTSGLKTTGGNDGLLNIQSNGSTVVAVTGSGISVTGTVSQTGVSTFAAGTVSAPSITFTGDTNTGIFSPAADTIAFTEGGVESMRIDASGNVGVGVTPSAWYVAGGTKALQIGARGSLFSFSGTTTDVGNNVYQSAAGDYSYIASATTSIYRQSSGSHQWYTAPSGTAGNAITFTQVLAVEKDKSLALQGATSQSGTGITFPATQSASTDANTLDDYEEGTWTPGITFGGNSTGMTFLGRSGRYVKIGKMVYAGFNFGLSNKGSSTGGASLTGLPFASGNTAGSQRYSGACGYYDNFSGIGMIQLLIEQNATQSGLRYATATISTAITDANFTNTSGMHGIYIYETD